MLSPKEKEEAIRLAKVAIAQKLGFEINLPKLSKSFLCKNGCCFVTLYKNEELRGCIGSFIQKPLAEAIKENAILAAFSDPRFPPLTSKDFSNVKIEISILSNFKKLNYKSTSDLLKKLANLKPGVIISYSGKQATFLPQVWEQLQEPADFLSHLCLKANLNPFIWKNRKLDILIYKAEIIQEK
ncbi:MAG: AmmeMemoRadiSam system protein A [Candidatus Nanoarchaeia archaeon]